MRIASLRLQNFRCFRDEKISFDNYTCLVGCGGAGKSTILTALRIFFRDAAGSQTDLFSLQEEDFHLRNTSNDIIITVTFFDLEQDAQNDFRHYFRQERLVVSAVAKWNPQTRSAEVAQFGERMAMAAFKDFFKAVGEGTSVTDLRSIYSRIRQSFSELPTPGTKQAMIDALTAFETGHPELCELVASEDQFYGFTKGSNRLQNYVQWVFVPAVKDASTEQLEAKRTALGLLLERTVRSRMSFSGPLADLRAEVATKYQALVDQNQGALEALSKSLSARLQDWAHPEANLTLAWRNEPARCISISEPLAEVLAGEGQFRGNLARFGHGLQRSFLLALLQELSGCGDTGNPKLILACEEPELYQHPPQARHLSSVLQKLSTLNTQVIVSTHSPYFISGRGFQDVRLLRRDLTSDQPSVRGVDFESLSEKLADALGETLAIPNAMEFKVEQTLQPVLDEMFFSPVLILVEGLEDLAYISTYITLTDRAEEFRRLGCHIVPTSGKANMIQPLAIARLLDIPTFVIFDADGDDTNRDDRKKQHARDNIALLRLCSIDNPNPFPTTIFSTSSLLVWPTELGTMVKSEIGQSDWDRYETTVKKKRGIIDVPDLSKNVVYIGLLLAEMFQDGKSSGTLDGLCSQIIAYARSVRASSPPERAAGATASGGAPQAP
jgi:putative ATP-dependent endonuclease of the OLD family